MKKLLLVQIDGLSYPVLLSAIDQGIMPYTKSLVDSGYTPQELFCGLPSTTPASQMSILYGVSNLIVGFRFIDRGNGTFFIPTKAPAVERMEALASSMRKDRLATHTAAVCSIFTGAHESISLGKVSLAQSSRSTILRIVSYLSNPFTTLYLFLKILVVALLEYVTVKKEGKKDIAIHTYLHHLGTRLAEETATGDLGLTFSKRLMTAGHPVVFVNFAGYDTLSHHAGPRSRSALFCLSLIDMYIEKLHKFILEKEYPYELAVFSDHGQIPCVPFSQKFRKPLTDVIREWYPDKKIAYYQNLFESLNIDADLNLLFSGGLALLYVPQFDHAHDADEIEHMFPKLLSRLGSHPAIAFAASRKKTVPVLLYGDTEAELTAEHLARAAPFVRQEDIEKVVTEIEKLIRAPHAADVYLFSNMIDDTTGITFEESFGAHGSIGGNQTRSFFLSKSIHFQKEIHNFSQVHDVLLSYITR